MWPQLAMMGVQFLGNYAQQKAKEKQVKNNNKAIDAANLEELRANKLENKLSAANVYASNTVREANNELSAVSGSLNRFRIGLGDRQTLRTSGREQEQIQTNLFRAIKDASTGALEDRLDTAYDMGALAASASAAGVGGGSREVMNATLRMTGARRQSALEEAQGDMTYDAMRLLTNTQADAYAQLDTSVIFDQLDLQVDQFIPKVPRIQNLQGPASGGLLSTALQTVTQNPQLTQQVAEGFRSTGTTSYSGEGWAANVRV